MNSGFVSIVGKPNVGKSTLLNRLVGSKLAAISRKPQTTRQIIRGILTEARGQIVFLDTPGFHHPRDPLGRFMVQQASKTFVEADLIYCMFEPFVPEPLDLELVERLKQERKPLFCLINKIDRRKKPELLAVIKAFESGGYFQEIVPVSAQKGDQLDVLLQTTFRALPEHEPYFPPGIVSDQPERFLAAEIIREKIFRFTGAEIPYAAALEIESYLEEEALVRIHATIFVERESQKAIVIGREGAKLKQIGTAARRDLERFLGRKVFLKLWTKTLKNWKRSERDLKRLGYQ